MGFPSTAEAFQSFVAGDTDAYLVKLNPSGTALLYGTLLGGSGTDRSQTASGNSRAAPGESFGEFLSIRTADSKVTTRSSDRLLPASSQRAGNSGALRIIA